jgi:hypothetical protein
MELGVSAVGAFALANNENLESVTVPHSLSKLGFGAFGLGRREKKTVIYVDNEYMCRRMKRLLFWCGSAGRAIVCMQGKTIEERKRERRRTSLDQKAEHIS